MKKLILVLLTVILIGLACWLIGTLQKPPPLPPQVTLPDGTSLRIIAVTYGTNHLVGTKLARLTARLPAKLQTILKPILGQQATLVRSLTTPAPGLVVWVDRETNRLGTPISGLDHYEAFLGDGTNFISGAGFGINSYLPSQIEPLHFSAFPRRDREITLNIFQRDPKGVVRLCNSLSFANPLRQTYPQWASEPLPAIKYSGDLEVTLQGLETGHDANSTQAANRNGRISVTHGTDRADGRTHTAVALNLRSLSNTNESWQVTGVEVSDASGNRTHNASMSSRDNAGVTFYPSLWPAETAWKLNLALKRTEGFRPGELFSFKNVPLGELNNTNLLSWTSNFAGLTVTFETILRREPQTNSSWSSSDSSTVVFTTSTLPKGTHVDLLHVLFDTGTTNRSTSSSWSNNKREYSFREIPLAARTADFVFAIHQSRTVEFTVKPQLPK